MQQARTNRETDLQMANPGLWCLGYSHALSCHVTIHCFSPSSTSWWHLARLGHFTAIWNTWWATLYILLRGHAREYTKGWTLCWIFAEIQWIYEGEAVLIVGLWCDWIMWPRVGWESDTWPPRLLFTSSSTFSKPFALSANHWGIDRA